MWFGPTAMLVSGGAEPFAPIPSKLMPVLALTSGPVTDCTALSACGPNGPWRRAGRGKGGWSRKGGAGVSGRSASLGETADLSGLVTVNPGCAARGNAPKIRTSPHPSVSIDRVVLEE